MKDIQPLDPIAVLTDMTNTLNQLITQEQDDKQNGKLCDAFDAVDAARMGAVELAQNESEIPNATKVAWNIKADDHAGCPTNGQNSPRTARGQLVVLTRQRGIRTCNCCLVDPTIATTSPTVDVGALIT